MFVKSSTAYNPFIYFFLSQNFRKDVKKVFSFKTSQENFHLNGTKNNNDVKYQSFSRNLTNPCRTNNSLFSTHQEHAI